MSKSLKERTISAAFWSFIDKGGQQIIQFVVIFILARLLLPAEVGLIGVLTIFVAVANLLQESGFSSALIRKRDVDELDYSTVFYFNISISICIYLLLFIVAPYIAKFYDSSILTALSRFLFLSFIFSALGIVQNIHLVKEMNFRLNAKITLFAVIVSGGIAVYMAYKGYGVWSLAVQQVSQNLLRTLLLWLFVKWLPREKFSYVRFKSMSSYSFKLLLNALFGQIANNIYNMVIGKRFSMTDAGLYSQAYKLGSIPQATLASSLQTVVFPLLSNISNSDISKKKIFRKIVRMVSFCSFPIALFTIVAAEPIVLTVFTIKWAGVIPLLQILSVGCAVIPLFYLISALLQSEGKSGLLLLIEFIRNFLSIFIIFFTISHGVYSVVIGSSVVLVVSVVIGYVLAGKVIQYHIIDFLKDTLPYLFTSTISYGLAFSLSFFISNSLVLLCLIAILGTVFYIFLLHFWGSKTLVEFISIIRKKHFF